MCDDSGEDKMFAFYGLLIAVQDENSIFVTFRTSNRKSSALKQYKYLWTHQGGGS